jgi:hypothetical protein
MTKDERITILWNRIRRVDKAFCVLGDEIEMTQKQRREYNETRDDLMSITRDAHVLCGEGDN